MIGSMEEAKEIWDYYTNQQYTDDFDETRSPDGWSYVGDGSSRIAYLSPSGVVYKVQRFADDEFNADEHVNFAYIRQSGKLPDGWRIPDSSLYQFTAIVMTMDYQRREPVPSLGDVKVIALEFIEGVPIGYQDYAIRREMLEGMEKVGLIDGARGNTLLTSEGFCIVDAGECPLAELVAT